MTTVESGVQLFSRVLKHTSLEGINSKLFPSGGPEVNHVIEVVGDSKDHFLLDFLVRCILPKDLNEEWKSSGAILLNTDHHLGILRITTALDCHLKRLAVPSRARLIEKALANLTVINCYDYEQLKISFLNLEKLVQKNDNCSLIIVDNLAFQYWVVKGSQPMLSLEQYAKTNFTILHNVVKSLGLVLIFARDQNTNMNDHLSPHVDYKIITQGITHALVIKYDENLKEHTVQFKLENLIDYV